MKFETLCILVEGKGKLKSMPVELKPVADFIDYARSVAREGTAPFRRDELEERAEKMMVDITSNLTKTEFEALKKHVLEVVDLMVNGYGDVLFGIDAGDFTKEIASARPRPSPGFTAVGKAKNEAEKIFNQTPGW